MPLVTIIMPVYNAEQYLASSIDSILAQSVKDFELLLINDGSKDSSLEICREYALKDSRIRVFDKPNGGVSSARNMGLDEAQGEWIMFVDSDDWLTEDAVAQCMGYLADNDIVRFSYKSLSAGNSIGLHSVGDVSSSEALFALQLERRTLLAVWGAMYRRELFVDNGICFDPTITYGEDWLLSMRLSLCARRVKTLPASYCYVYNTINMSSCTNNLSSKRLVEQLRVLRIVRSLLGENLGKHRRSMRTAYCKVLREMLKYFSFEEVLRELMAQRHSIDPIRRRDILLADISLRKKYHLLRFCRYCRANGLLLRASRRNAKDSPLSSSI